MIKIKITEEEARYFSKAADIKMMVAALSEISSKAEKTGWDVLKKNYNGTDERFLGAQVNVENLELILPCVKEDVSAEN